MVGLKYGQRKLGLQGGLQGAHQVGLQGGASGSTSGSLKFSDGLRRGWNESAEVNLEYMTLQGRLEDYSNSVPHS